MKADKITKVLHYLRLQKTKSIFHLKKKYSYFFQILPVYLLHGIQLPPKEVFSLTVYYSNFSLIFY